MKNTKQQMRARRQSKILTKPQILPCCNAKQEKEDVQDPFVHQIFGFEAKKFDRKLPLFEAETSSQFDLKFLEKGNEKLKVDNRPTARSSRNFEQVFQEDEKEDGLSILNKCFYIPSKAVSRKSQGSSTNRYAFAFKLIFIIIRIFIQNYEIILEHQIRHIKTFYFFGKLELVK